MKSTANGIIIHKGKILLLLRDNIPSIDNPNTWSLPGGEIEVNESIEEAFLREIREEINLITYDYSYLGKFSDLMNNIFHAIYFIELNDQELGHLKLGNEGQKFQFFKYAELTNIPLTPNLKKYIQLYGDYVQKIIEDPKIKINPSLLGLTS